MDIHYAHKYTGHVDTREHFITEWRTNRSTILWREFREELIEVAQNKEGQWVDVNMFLVDGE